MSILYNLFLKFLKIGFLSIGGGYAIIPLIQEQIVQQDGWISEKMFTDIITISQMTPGPLAINTSTFVGLQIGGIAGAIIATTGCVISGIVISLILYRFFQKHKSSVYVFEVLNGLKSASLGLIISAAVTIILLALFKTKIFSINDIFFNINFAALIIFLAMIFLLRKRKINPLIVISMSGILGLVFYL